MRRLLIIVAGLGVLAIVGVVAAIGITMLRSDDPDLRTEAPAIPTAGLDVAPATTAPPTGAAPSAGVLRFTIDQSGSEAKYVVRETLRGVVGAFAVGTTNAITGDIYLTPQGLANGNTSKFTVDLRQLKTDESLRDNFVRQNVLRTNQFPNAEFVAESITGFPAGYVEGQEATMTMRGNLTIRGVTKPVEWAVKARRAGDTLTGIADLRFNMTEFGITPPNVRTAQAEDGVQLQITILAKLAA
jgi:polyisoprenoid-binding protein YceI